MKTIKAHLAYIVLTFIIATVGIFFRIYPATYNLENHKKSLARLLVYKNIRQQAMQTVELKYPNISAKEKNQLSDNLFKEIIHKEKKDIIKATTETAKAKENNNKFYLLEADPYYYLRLTKLLLTHGNLSEYQMHGKFFDPLMLSPDGCWRDIEMHPYIGLLLFKLLKLFYNNIELTNALSLTSLVLTIISVIFFVLICRLLNFNKNITLISGIFFVLSPIFLQRSMMGWYDTDPYNIIFPFAITLIILSYLKNNHKNFWITMLGITSGLYSLFWQGWTMLCCFIIFVFVSLVIYNLIIKKAAIDRLKHLLLYIFTLLLTSYILTTPEGTMNSIEETLNIARNFLHSNAQIWPDMFIMVGELKELSLLKMMHLLGGVVFSSIAIIGFIVLAWRSNINLTREKSLVIISLSSLSVLMAFSAQRFVLFMVPFFSLCFAFGLSAIHIKIKTILTKYFNNKTAIITANILIYSSIISPLIYGHFTASVQNPIFNQAWENALEKIKSETPNDSIINTWWPPGHFIRAIAERGVSMDGATFEMPNSYWIARFLMADTEEESIGILKMLNSSGNRAVDFLTTNGFPIDKAVSIINSTIKLDNASAAKALTKYLPNKKIKKALSLIFSKPRPSYCLIYNELIENTIGLYFIQNWNFTKALDANRKRSFKRGSNEYVNFLWSLSASRPYIGKESYSSFKEGDTITFENGVVLNTRQLTAKINKLENQITGIPQSIIYKEGNKVIEKKLDNANLNLSVLLITHPNQIYSCIVAPSKILGSTLFKLYYLNGAGLNKFSEIISEDDPTLNTKILVYEINF